MKGENAMDELKPGSRVEAVRDINLLSAGKMAITITQGKTGILSEQLDEHTDTVLVYWEISPANLMPLITPSGAIRKSE